jgi:hypothetical protein
MELKEVRRLVIQVQKRQMEKGQCLQRRTRTFGARNYPTCLATDGYRE